MVISGDQTMSDFHQHFDKCSFRLISSLSRLFWDIFKVVRSPILKKQSKAFKNWRYFFRKNKDEKIPQLNKGFSLTLYERSSRIICLLIIGIKVDREYLKSKAQSNLTHWSGGGYGKRTDEGKEKRHLLGSKSNIL